MKNLLAFILLLIWLCCGAWFYTCKVKNLCADEEISSVFKSKINSQTSNTIDETLDEDNNSDANNAAIDSNTNDDASDQNNTENSSTISSMEDNEEKNSQSLDEKNENDAEFSNTNTNTSKSSYSSSATTYMPSIEFDYVSHVIKSSSSLTNRIQRLKEYLEENDDKQVILIGHENSFEGGDYSGDLGMDRANAVKQIFIDNGIDAGNIEVVSKGASSPLLLNSEPIGRIKNSRVDIKIN